MCEIERMTAIHCAATLLGEKTGSMFLIRWAHFRRSKRAVARVRESLARRGFVLRVLGAPGGARVYAYRPESLERVLADERARSILVRFGYGADAFSCLQRRLLSSPQFPHEIGLFLGYPAADVAGFIENGGKNSKLTGYWKVYHDAERARCLFCAYKQCRERMMSLVKSGMPFQEILCEAQKGCHYG